MKVYKQIIKRAKIKKEIKFFSQRKKTIETKNKKKLEKKKMNAEQKKG